MNNLSWKINLCICFTFLFLTKIVGQNASDLPEKKEVFFHALFSDIQSGNYTISDSTHRQLKNAEVYFKKKNSACDLSNIDAINGRLYLNKGQVDSATLYFIDASKKLTSDCPSFNRYYLYNSWARLKQQIQEYKSCDSLYQLALVAASDLDDKSYMLNVKINQSIVFSILEKYPEAIALMQEVYELAKENQLKYHELLSLQNLGAYNIDLKKYDAALNYYLKLNAQVDSSTPPRLIMDVVYNMALIYDQKEEFGKANEYFLKAIELAKANKEQNALKTYLLNYSKFNYEIENFEAAYNYLAEHEAVKEQLFDQEKYEVIKDLETQYDTAKQKQQILEQKLEIERKNRNRNSMLFALLALVLILVALYSRLTYIRRSKKIVEAEKKRSDDLLLNILPHEVAEELKETGVSEAKDFENVSVLFTDFKGFTEVAEKLSAKDLVAEINNFFQEFDRIVTKHGVEKIKTIGDSYMAACGIPKPNSTSSKVMLRAAIEMLQFANDRNKTYSEQGKPTFEMRIGIHRGPIVAGIVGVKKFQYDIWGDTVNTASRMESSCEPGYINVSHEVYEALKNDDEFSFEYRGELEVKGKGQLKMYYATMKK